MAACPQAFAPLGSGAGSSRAVTPTSGCSSATPRAPSAPRASPPRARRPRRCSAGHSAAGSSPPSGTAAAPVLACRELCRLDALRAVLANSGCANAATGARGLDNAAKTQGAAALAVGADPAEVALASTGGISQRLPVDAILKGILAARSRLRPDGDADFQMAIQTTDGGEKRAS